MKQFEVTIDGGGKTFQVREGENILVAALRQGVMLPYSCKNGTCGSCKGVLETGEVHYPFHPPLALEKSDFADGYALMCQAEPIEDLVIRVREIEAVRDIQVRMLSMGVPHMAIPLTGAMCAGVAARITGTLVQESARMDVAGDTLRVGNGSGVLPVSASVSRRDDGWYAERVSVCRTVRVLMAGQVFVPDGEL